MKIIILLIALLVSPLNSGLSQGAHLAMPHTHQVEKVEKIGQMAKKVLQYVK